MLVALLQDLPDVASSWGDLVAPIGGLAFAALLVRLALGQADKRAAVAEKREEKCSSRQDLVLEDNRSQAATIKDLSTAVVRTAGLAEDSFALAKTTSEKIDAIQRSIERLPSTTRERS